MGCKKHGHIHTWPTRGTLTIQRCEVRCNFCTGDAAYKDWKYAWFLRRHVRAIHVKKGKYKGLQVDAGWDDENPRDGTENRRGSEAVKLESPGSDDYGITQTTGELAQGPLPDFITQSNFGNVDSHTYNTLHMGLGGRNTITNHTMQGVAYGNPNAQFPTLAGEDAYGMDNTQIMDEFQQFVDSCSGFDGNLEVEQEDDNIVVASRGRVNEEDDEDDKELNPIPSSSEGRFFMANVTEPEQDLDEEDDMPLAERMNNYDYRSQAPTDQKHNAMLQIIQGISQSMEQSGIDPREMLPVVRQVMRALQHEDHSGFPYEHA